MNSEENNPLRPLQHVGLSAADKANLRGKLVGIMEQEEAGQVMKRNRRQGRPRRARGRMAGLFAGSAAVVVAGAIVADGAHSGWFSASDAGHPSSASSVHKGARFGTSTTGKAVPNSGAGAAGSATQAGSTTATAGGNSSAFSANGSNEAAAGSPEQVVGTPGGLTSAQSWPLLGANPQDTGTGTFVATYSSSGFTMGGVHWTWPASDTNPKHYIVVPTTVQGHPYLVWCHLAPQKVVGKPLNGQSSAVSQLEPVGAAAMYMTPWSPSGGSLSAGAQLVTNNIPPVFNRPVGPSYIFPANPKLTSPSALAGSAWTGWFHWGQSTPTPAPAVSVSSASASPPTVAVPGWLSPAYNGVVLTVNTQVLLANQGAAVNLYYLNLATHHITGLASLTNGGGRFYSDWVVSGLVLTAAANDLSPTGKLTTAAYAFNEATGQRVPLPPSDSFAGYLGFSNWSINGSKVYNATGKLVLQLTNLPAAATEEPSAATFGVK